MNMCGETSNMFYRDVNIIIVIGIDIHINL